MRSSEGLGKNRRRNVLTIERLPVISDEFDLDLKEGARLSWRPEGRCAVVVATGSLWRCDVRRWNVLRSVDVCFGWPQVFQVGGTIYSSGQFGLMDR